MSEYGAFEERLNIYSHLLGAILGIVGLVLLIMKSVGTLQIIPTIGLITFGFSIIFLYMSSTYYHSAKDPKKRFKRKVLDHCAIYVLIAGTYTPYCLGPLAGKLGWSVFALSWSLAFIGIVLKIFYTGRFKILSTIMYVLMGWMIFLFIGPLTEVLSYEGTVLLIAGGISYTVGALTYTIKKIKLNHAIFHLFVLIGTICHFLSIYLYVWPELI